MKHCHFSILWNEIAFLKQKLPFLYQHFDQLIFFDLNIKTKKFSNDGSHRFIKKFPDPQKKITLIEKRDLSDVTEYKGHSFGAKRKMFAVGSKYVRDNIDVFWCTDMDEFFNKSLIEKVESLVSKTKTGAILVPHVIFFKNEQWVFSRDKEDGELQRLPWARIATHKKGNLYGHCSLADQFGPVRHINDEIIYHFSYVGDKKVRNKCSLYSSGGYIKNIWSKFKFKNVDGKVYKKRLHPCLKLGIKKNPHKLPEYINIKEMMKDLKAEYE